MGQWLNLIGWSTGVALYAMLLAMVVRSDRTQRTPGRVDPLLLATSILGLLWNLCAVPAYELPALGIHGPVPLLTIVGFSALGLLPAVVLHSVLRREGGDVPGRATRLIVGAAYGVSVAAAALHGAAFLTGGPLPSPLAMQLLTYTYVTLVVPLAVVTRGQPSARRVLWVAALSVFAVSALHLSGFHQRNPSWPVELVGHHASLPLAFAILYQDFPFALADLFLKRAILLLALVTAAFSAVAGLTGAAAGNATLGAGGTVGVLVTLWVATALLYPWLRDLVHRFVDTVILHRPDYARLRADVGHAVQHHDDLGSMLDDVCARLGPALSARSVRWRPQDDPAHAGVPADARLAGGAVVEIPVAEAPRFAIEISELSGGRRLLSDDRELLAAVASLIGRRIDAIRITRERYARQMREQEIEKLTTEAELRALRAQINPHFLFNALTTVGYLIQTAPPRALDTLMRLTALLRGVLRSEGELTTLGRELILIESYLDIERARFEERLQVHIDVPSELSGISVPTLLLQPLVENAVKHGIARERRGGEVTVTGRLQQRSEAGPTLTLVVHDSGAGASAAEWERGRAAGIGLKNVERRLACQYGDAASLRVQSTPGRGTTAEIRLPAMPHVPQDAVPAGLTR
jgi:signal transduction histidine kinase